MNIRNWFLDGNKVEFSKTDIIVNEVLSNFKVIFEKITGDNFSNINSLAMELDSQKDIPNGFRNWFYSEGKELLIKLSNSRFCDNPIIEYELNYVSFIMSSEARGKLENLDDSTGLMADILHHLDKLLFQHVERGDLH